MPIIDKQAVRFSDEQVRVSAEDIRDLHAKLTDLVANWNGGINALFPNDASALDDGRDAEGVSRLTGSDVNGLITQASGILSFLNGAGVMDVVRKPTVRSLTLG